MAVKRALDLVGGLLALLLSLPVVGVVAALIWLQDRHNPFFVSRRVGRAGREFRLVKLRSMTPHAERSGVNTVIAGNPQVTRIGRFIRATKIDELPQFLHVVAGTMSLVGPRPNLPQLVAEYSQEERGLLTVKPGVTDLSSIAFADLSERLAGEADANVAYDELIRPWKGYLGLLYVRHRVLWLDLACIGLTLWTLVSRRGAARALGPLLRRLAAEPDLVEIVTHERPLRAARRPDLRKVAARL